MMNTQQLERELARRSYQVAALSQIAQALSASVDVETVARTALTYALDLAEMDAGEIMLWDDERRALVQLMHAGLHPEVFAERLSFAQGEGVPGRVLETGHLFRIDPTVHGGIMLRPGISRVGFRTMVSVPLRNEDMIIGVLNVASKAVQEIDGDMEELLLGLGGQAGTALDRAVLYDRERELHRRMQALNEASLSIAAELSLSNLLQRIVEIARDLTGARYAALGVANENRQIVEFLTAGITPEERARMPHPPEGHGLLGLILEGDQPVRIRSIAEHPASYGFPPGHPPMESFVGVPIILRGRNLGNLYLTEKKGGEPFTEDDERLLVQLAAHAAIAIENAQLYGRTSESLERRVEELRHANAQLAYLSSLAINAQEEERRRLARELHDDTAQELASLLVRLRVLERTEDPRELRARLHDFRELIARALDGVRRMAIDLRPSTLDDLGLVPAVESHARAMAERWGVKVRMHASGIDRRFAPQTELVAYRIVQEALSNVFKHAAATEVTVDLERRGNELCITVRDNGRGFDVDRTLASKERGLGLFGMNERAALVNGRVSVQSTPEEGTTVSACLPIRDIPPGAGPVPAIGWQPMRPAPPGPHGDEKR